MGLHVCVSLRLYVMSSPELPSILHSNYLFFSLSPSTFIKWTATTFGGANVFYRPFPKSLRVDT